jgi:heme exporter protein D
MQHLIDYLAMGGYAAFVWPAYGLTTIVMAGLLVQTWRRYRRAQRELAELQQARPGGPRRRAS